MKTEQMKITTLEAAFAEPCPKGLALERWQDLVWELDASVCHVFAVMAGLAAPLMGLVSDQPVVINFFGGTPRERRRLLDLAVSCWMDPAEIEDTLANVSWKDMGAGFGFSYAPDVEEFSTEVVKEATCCRATRMAVVCGKYALDEQAYQDESIGGVKVLVLNLDIGKLDVRTNFGEQTNAVEAALSNLWESYSGQFLMQFMLERETCIDGIRGWIKDQAQLEYEDDLARIVQSMRDDEPSALDQVPAALRDQVLSILSIIKAITVVAIDEDVLPDIQHFAILSDIHSHVIHASQRCGESVMLEGVS